MRWYYLGKALKPLGVDVEIVSSASFHKYLAPPKVEDALHTQKIDDIVYHWLKTKPYSSRGVRQVINQIEFVLGCYRFRHELCARKPNLVIASSPHPLVSFPAVSIARKVGADFFFEVRDLWPQILIELGRFSRWHPYIIALRVAERYGVKYAKKIISVKPGDYKYFKHEYKVPPENFCYIPNGFLPDQKSTIAPGTIQDLRRRYSFILGYVGALSSYYSLEHMIHLANIFKTNDNVGFVIIGKGDRKAELKKMIANFDLVNCHLIGPVAKTEVPACLELFDACYVGLEELAIHRYGISCNKIYEYMYAGKPIIGSYVCGYDPVVRAGCGVTARPGDYRTLVKYIKRLIDNEEIGQKNGECGKSYFNANHNFCKVAEIIVDQFFYENN